MSHRHGLFGPAVFLFWTALCSTAWAQGNTVNSPPPGPIYVVTYVETMPARSSDSADLLRKYRQTSAAATGNLRSLLLARLDRRGQFVLLTAWQNPDAWSSHLTDQRTYDEWLYQVLE